ncbi:tyrosine-type recombinase/integrase [Sporosarcina highlanderae]|uniref:Tyrosine-type recombinase/integrase n=1 Tax=Sporosarcina highlanderae TaxID=3035916 RepID=A0ABT8JQ36_9BACL|nr:tyrosine-type recombinase/integrase [Sporosarcina highlanderae]MDN4607174.1 tyrosine-type recombinase/integrase [Sporosarcina highlanderae]
MRFGKTGNYFSLEAIIDDARVWLHFVLINLLYKTAAKVNKIINLEVKDLNLKRNNCVIKNKSLKTNRIINLSTSTTELVEQYILQNSLKENQKLFYQGYNITQAEICRHLRMYIKRARIKEPNLIPDYDSVCGFRISRAIHLYQSGYSIESLTYLFGHSDDYFTNKYIRVVNM